MLDIKILGNIFYLLSMASFFFFLLRNQTKSCLGFISKAKQKKKNLNEHQDMPEEQCLQEGPLTKLVTPGLI